MAEKPTLYSYWRSSCSWRVRIALALKGIEYDIKEIHLLRDGGEQNKQDYIEVNPFRGVPTFVQGDFSISQSLAIIEYLEEKYPETYNLLPKSPEARAQVRKLALAVACDIQPLQNLKVLIEVGEANKMAWGKKWIAQGLAALEKYLEKTAGVYSFGDNITLADLCLVPQVYNANRFGVDMSQFPIISRVNDELIKHEAFSAPVEPK